MKSVFGNVISEKTRLQIALPVTLDKKSNPVSMYHSKVTKYIVDEDGKEVVKSHREKYNYSFRTVNQYQTAKPTDLFTVCCMRYAIIFVHQSLTTIYAKVVNTSSENTIKKLLDETRQLAFVSDFRPEEYQDYLQNNLDEIILPRIQEKVANGQLSKSEAIKAEQDTMQYAKLHTYTMIQNGNRKYKVEIVPYTELKLTEYGKDIVTNQNIQADLEASDLVQNASLAILELFRYGLVCCPSDIWNYSGYVYKAINKGIYSNRRKANEASFDQTFMHAGKLDSVTRKIEVQSIMQDIVLSVYNALPKKCNRANTIYVFKHHILSDKTQQYCADMLGVDQRTVVNYVSTIRKTIASNSDLARHIRECLTA